MGLLLLKVLKTTLGLIGKRKLIFFSFSFQCLYFMDQTINRLLDNGRVKEGGLSVTFGSTGRLDWR